MRVLALIFIFFVTASQAVELRDLGLTYHHYQEYSVFPELGGRHADQGLELAMDVDLVGPVFWNNAIHYMTEGSDSIYVGWNYQLGIRILPDLSAGWEHFSQHMIGQSEISPHFPLFDGPFVQWTIYSSGRAPASLF
jgi:hypothetical protein